MKGVLLDTCAMIWLASGVDLAPAAMTAIVAAILGPGVFITPVSAWEISLLAARGRFGAITTATAAQTWFSTFMARNGMVAAPFTAQVAIQSAHLPEFRYGDPADRFIVATARQLDIPVVTRDEKILDYARRGHVGAIPC